MKQLQLTDESYDNPADAAVLESRRVPLERKVVLKFHHFGGFFIEYSANISLTGMFIRTEAPKSPGSVFIFEIWLGDDYKLVHGLGEVVWLRHADEGPDRPAGMGVRYLKLGDESRAVVERVIAEHVQKGGDVFDLETAEPAPPEGGDLRVDPPLSIPKSEWQGELLVIDEKLLGFDRSPAEPQVGAGEPEAPRPLAPSRMGRRGLRIVLLLIVLAALMGGTAYLFSADLLPF